MSAEAAPAVVPQEQKVVDTPAVAEPTPATEVKATVCLSSYSHLCIPPYPYLNAISRSPPSRSPRYVSFWRVISYRNSHSSIPLVHSFSGSRSRRGYHRGCQDRRSCCHHGTLSIVAVLCNPPVAHQATSPSLVISHHPFLQDAAATDGAVAEPTKEEGKKRSGLYVPLGT